MIQFFKNFVSKESAFRSVVGGAGALVMAQPELILTLGIPQAWGAGLVALALLLKAGDKNEK
jgi:hypothetical protein